MSLHCLTDFTYLGVIFPLKALAASRFSTQYCPVLPSNLTMRLSSVVFRVSMIRKLLALPGVFRRLLFDSRSTVARLSNRPLDPARTARDRKVPGSKHACAISFFLRQRKLVGISRWPSSQHCSHTARPTLLKCENEYLVLALGEKLQSRQFRPG